MTEQPSSTHRLAQHLKTVLLDLSENPYPEVPSPPSTKKRASVALLIRFQPRHSHWPPNQAQDNANGTVQERIESFFAQGWVRNGDPEILFIKRSSRPGDRWNSHVALPGGRRDPEDEDDQATAVRETLEEVGIELSRENSIAVGNLPQRLVTTSWGNVPLMVLCPYVFLQTRHENPPIRLQPTEVGSTHWVSLRALLSPRQRTFEYQDVSNRLARAEIGIRRWFLRAALGKMLFAAIRLIPSESLYCNEAPGFIPDDVENKDAPIAARVREWWCKGSIPASATDKPLLLWGLTLGVVADFLELLPPHNALELWTYPTFTPWDVRFAVWAMSYSFRKRKLRELALGDHKHRASPAIDEDLDPAELPTNSSSETGNGNGKPGEVGIGGLGVGRYYGDAKRNRPSRPNAVGVMLEGYYDIVRRAVAVAMAGRVSALAVIALCIYRRRRGSA